MKQNIKRLLENQLKKNKAPAYLKQKVLVRIEIMKVVKALAEMYTVAPSKIIRNHIKKHAVKGGDTDAK